jgi:hypothetical protein
MRRSQRLGDLGASAEACVDQPVRLQPVKCLQVSLGALGLDDRLAIDGQPEPFDILKNVLNILRTAAARVEILDPQQEFAAAGPGMGMTKDRRKGVAEVKPSRRRRGETCDLQDSLHDKGAAGDS